MSRVLEICAGSVQSARAAQRGGAHRIELCQNLEQGGITPSHGLIRRVLEHLTIPVFVLIRPRPGNFVYDADELASMAADIAHCRALGCAGVVLGALTEAGHVAIEQCKALIEAAGPLQVTFHRAFDVCATPAQALEDLIGLGCQRLLTSGGAATAEAGQHQLAALVQQAAGRLDVMPGAGIIPANIRSLAAATGATEFHSSARQPVLAASATAGTFFEAPRWETNEATVAQLLAALT